MNIYESWITPGGMGVQRVVGCRWENTDGTRERVEVRVGARGEIKETGVGELPNEVADFIYVLSVQK